MRQEYLDLIEDCKRRVFQQGTWEQIQIIRHAGELMICELDLPDGMPDAFYAALADTLAEVYEDVLKWMTRTERELIEERVAIAVWMQVCHDLKGARHE